MANGVSYTHKAFSCKLSRAYSLKSKSSTELVPVSLDTVLNDLRSDIRLLTAMTEYQLAADPEIRSRVASVNGKPANAAGRQLGYTLPTELLPEAGVSRFLMLFRDKLVREVRSWNARTEAENGTREASQGWKRTADSTRPTELTPKISLSAIDNQYAIILWEPYLIRLRLVVSGKWYELQFDTDLSRFNKYAPFNKITLPDIREDSNGELVFSFTAAYEKVYPEISSKYVIGVDVGKNSFYAASVLDTETKRIVYSTLGSLRARRLMRSCKSTEKQITNLHKKAKRLRRSGLHLPENRTKHDNVLREIAQQRSKLSRKKRELAILAAQEVVDLSYRYGNAPVAVEDLSWIVNTMANGRWNRGEFVKRLTDYASSNGTVVKKVNAANTSQICYVCKTPVSHPEWEVSRCEKCGTEIHRDIGASGEIGSRCVNYFSKVAESRKKHSKKVKRIASRVPKTRESLKYPKTDRTKSSPTPKRPQVHKKEVKLPSRPLTGVATPTVVRDAESTAMASARLISATPSKASTQNWSPD